MEFEETSAREEEVAAEIVDAAYIVHKKLGPGVLERIYEVCLRAFVAISVTEDD